jgi:hypothetical protein
VIGTALLTMSGRVVAVERTVKYVGMVLIGSGLVCAGILWARAQGNVRVDAPVQLWLLLAVCLITGCVAIHASNV